MSLQNTKAETLNNETRQYDGEIVIEIEGGCVQAVYSGAEINLRVRILDHDNLKEFYDRDHRDRIAMEAVADLIENDTEEIK